MVTTIVKAVKNKTGKGVLSIEETLGVCKNKLEENCFVYVQGGDVKKPFGNYRKVDPGTKQALSAIERRIKTMLAEEKSVVIKYDNRGANIKEGKIEEELAKQEKTGWLTR